MDSIQSLLKDDPESGQNNVSKSVEFAESCPSLSFKHRLWGFGICFVGGFVIGILATFMLFFNIITFAVLYTIGNLMALMSTMFLVGPLRQLKNIFDGTRIIAAAVLFASMALTLFSAFFFKEGAVRIILCLLFLIIQFAALIWYSLSYIPFARNVIKSCVRGLCV